MTARPGADFREPLKLKSTLLFDWRADTSLESPVSLDSLRQVATFTRASTKAGTDVAGTSYTAAQDQPAWMRWLNPTTSAYEPVLSLDAALTESLTWAFYGRFQAMTLYIDWIYRGVDGCVLSLGSVANTTPRVMLYYSTGFKAHFHNGTSAVESGAPAGSLVSGERVESLVTVLSTGVVQHSWLRQGQTVVDTGSASGTLSLAAGSAFGVEKVSASRYNGATGEGTLGLRQVKIAAGTVAFATMQTLF
jgi:hypothetical protein